jgi:hypothetical protein
MTPFDAFHAQAPPIITEALERARATDSRRPNLQLWVESVSGKRGICAREYLALK